MSISSISGRVLDMYGGKGCIYNNGKKMDESVIAAGEVKA